MTKYFSLYWIVNKTKFRAQILPDAENWGPKIASERERKRKWSFNPPHLAASLYFLFLKVC